MIRQARSSHIHVIRIIDVGHIKEHKSDLFIILKDFQGKYDELKKDIKQDLVYPKVLELFAYICHYLFPCLF